MEPNTITPKEIDFLKATIRLQQAALALAELALRPESGSLVAAAHERVVSTLAATERHRERLERLLR